MTSGKKGTEIIDITSNIAQLAPGLRIYYHEASEREVEQLALKSDSYLQTRAIDTKDKDVELIFRRSKAFVTRDVRAKAARRTIIIVVISPDTIIVIILKEREKSIVR